MASKSPLKGKPSMLQGISEGISQRERIFNEEERIVNEEDFFRQNSTLSVSIFISVRL